MQLSNDNKGQKNKTNRTMNERTHGWLNEVSFTENMYRNVSEDIFLITACSNEIIKMSNCTFKDIFDKILNKQSKLKISSNWYSK